MAQTVGDYLLHRLNAWGVDHVFSYPGDGINGIVAAFGKTDDRPAYVQARHEEMAAFEATGYAKYTGRVGVVLTTSGPGAIHALNGLYDAKLDHVPVVAIVGHTARSKLGGSYQQEVDLQSLFKDVAAEYVVTVSVAEQLPDVIDRAFRIAHAEQAPTCIIIPNDLQEEEYTPAEHIPKAVESQAPGFVTPITRAPDEEVGHAADVLNAGNKVAILVGQGAKGAADEVVEVAERTGAGVAKALLGKDVLPDDLPFVTGSIGLLGSRPSWELMQECDTLLMVGTSFPYAAFMPARGQARAVEIDIQGKFIGLRYPTEVNLVGDAAETLRALIPLLEHKSDRSWRDAIEKNVSHWWDTVERRSMTEADPINPMRVVWDLNSRIPHNAMVSSDSGSAANWFARQLKVQRGMRCSLSGTLATMGPGVPYAIGAKFGNPERLAIALVGDGAMQMNGMAELITMRRYYEEWSDPRAIVCIFHNNDLNQVTWELRAMGGHPMFEGSQSLPEVDYAGFAQSLGLHGVYVDKPEEIGEAWDDALRADRPTVLDVRTDPDIPPIPPHATVQQMKDTAQALMSGDPEAWGVAEKGARTKLKDFLPGSRK